MTTWRVNAIYVMVNVISGFPEILLQGLDE